MSKPFIFVSCGQFTPAEKALGKTIVAMVKDITGLDAFFAEDVQDLNGLDSNILAALHDCAGFITVLHPRGKIIRPDGSEHIRASVWIEQEIAIATYIHRVEKRPLPVIAFVHEAVGREGIRDLLHLNPIPFRDDLSLLLTLRTHLEAWRDLPGGAIDVQFKTLVSRGGTSAFHPYSRLSVTILNKTAYRIDDISAEMLIPRGALEHEHFPQEADDVNYADDNSYWLYRLEAIPRIPPHGNKNVVNFYFCVFCALDPTKYTRPKGSDITMESTVKITVWTGGRSYSMQKTLRELSTDEDRKDYALRASR